MPVTPKPIVPHTSTTNKKTDIQYKTLSELMEDADDEEIKQGGINWKKAHADWDKVMDIKRPQKPKRTWLDEFVDNPCAEKEGEDGNDEDLKDDDDEDEEDDDVNALATEMKGFIIEDEETEL
jgi:hypothetical protein